MPEDVKNNQKDDAQLAPRPNKLQIEVKSTRLYAFGKPGRTQYVDDDPDYRNGLQ